MHEHVLNNVVAVLVAAQLIGVLAQELLQQLIALPGKESRQ